MSTDTKQTLALGLVGGVFVAWFILISITAGRQKRMTGVPAVTAVMAYTCYVAAALLADAEFPAFLREHLFDGLAPAAAVGLLVNRFPTESPGKALPRIRRPVMVLIVFSAGGALIFGLIAAAAVFSSGTGNFALPVKLCAGFGAFLFFVAYFGVGTAYVAIDLPSKPKVEWWFAKRPRHAATPEPGAHGDTAVPAPADAAEGGTALHAPGNNLPASPEAP